MSLTMRWAGEADYDKVAQARALSFGAGANEQAHYAQSVTADPRAKAGDFLLAMDGAQPVGTTTALDLTMWVRGAPLPCQGVAYVGTVLTARRFSGGGGERGRGQRGIASQLMDRTLARAREKGQVISALMPFRASFYEHFGYGVIERRREWTVPLSILPQPASGDQGVGLCEPADLKALWACRQRIAQAGQCDIERSEAAWPFWLGRNPEHFHAIDIDAGGVIRGWLLFARRHRDGRDYLSAGEIACEDIASLRRLLGFMATLRDQYHSAQFWLAADLPLHWLLRERQLPHRPVNHATAATQLITRMQARVLDHQRLLESMRWPAAARGRAAVAVRESEGGVSKFQIDASEGRATARATDAAPDVEMTDVTWAAVALGELKASEAARLGLMEVNRGAALDVLDWLSAGAAPFTHEYF
jgi:predicted acetyltransferase